jgi:predicted MFS family arabinose efflux permease
MAACNGISALFFLPETNTNRNTTRLTYNPVLPLLKAFRNQLLRPIFTIWLIFSLAFVIVQSTFALYTQNIFGFDSFKTGMLFTVIGIVVILNQTLLLRKFWLHRFTEHQLLVVMMSFLFIGLVLSSLKYLPLFIFALLFIGTGQAILRVVISSQAIAGAEPRMKGEIMGINASILSASMVVGPIIGGFLFEKEHALPYYFAAGLMAMGVFVSLQLKNAHTRSEPL